MFEINHGDNNILCIPMWIFPSSHNYIIRINDHPIIESKIIVPHPLRTDGVPSGNLTVRY